MQYISNMKYIIIALQVGLQRDADLSKWIECQINQVGVPILFLFTYNNGSFKYL